jgi:CubicO group peptidase (beta-lactamase class C family)
MAAVVGAGLSPALAVAVFDRERTLFAAGYGDAGDGERRRDCDRSTPFRWFSVTKLLTATTVLALAGRDALSVADRAVDHLPWFRAADPLGAVTVEDLLAHTSGLGNPLPFRWGRPIEGPDWDVAAEVRALVERHGSIGAGARGAHRYSNLGYLVLGEIVRCATGEPLEAHARSLVLEPLGMSSARFGVDPARPYDTAPPHEPIWHPRPWIFAGASGGWGRFIDGLRAGFVRVHPFKLLGVAFGDVVGSVADAARFGSAHLSDGELDRARVLDAVSARRMRALGWGWMRGRDTLGEIVAHTGSGIGYRSELRLYPSLGIGAVVLANAGHVATEPFASALVGAIVGDRR